MGQQTTSTFSPINVALFGDLHGVLGAVGTEAERFEVVTDRWIERLHYGDCAACM